MTSHEELFKQIRSKIIESTSPASGLVLNYTDTWDEAWLEDLSVATIESNIKLLQNETQKFNDQYQIVYDNELSAVQKRYADDFKKEIDDKVRKLTSNLNKAKSKKSEQVVVLKEPKVESLDQSVQVPSLGGLPTTSVEEPKSIKPEPTSTVQESALDELEQELAKLRIDVVQLPARAQEIAELKEQLEEKDDLLREATSDLKKLQTDRSAQSASLLKATEQNLVQLKSAGTVVTEQLKKALDEDKKEASEHRTELENKRQELRSLEQQNEETTRELNKATEALERAQLASDRAEDLRKELQNEAIKREEVQTHLTLLEEERNLRIERFNLEIQMHEKVIEGLRKQQEKAPRLTRQVFHESEFKDTTDGEPEKAGVSTDTQQISVPNYAEQLHEKYGPPPAGLVYRNVPPKAEESIAPSEANTEASGSIAPNQEMVGQRHLGVGNRAKTHVQIRTNNSSEDEATTQVKANIQFKLDRVELPMFDGDLTEWNSFKEIFTVLIHDNDQISKLLKLHQLKSHLRGAALETIRGYQLTGSNYTPAWTDLNQRYNKTDDIIHEYIRKFIETPVLQHHAPAQRIQAIINGTNQMMRALPGVGIEVGNWDPFISFVILSKLDEATRRDWHKSVGHQTNVPVKKLVEFLELKAREVQPTQAEHMYQMLQGKKPFSKHATGSASSNSKIFQVNNQSGSSKNVNSTGNSAFQVKCPFCKGAHRLFHCEKFRKLRAKDRLEEVKKLKLCFKCFGEHMLRDCPSRDCPVCNGKHNSLLCFQKEARDQPGPSNLAKN